MKKKIYVLVIIILIFLLSVWQYQKYMNNKISMSEILQKMEDAIKKENYEIYKLVVSDIKIATVEDIKTYTIIDKEEIEKFTALFENLKGTTLNTNKKGIVGTDYEYSLLFYFGYQSSDGEYIEIGRFYLDLNEDKVDAFRLYFLKFWGDGGRMRIDINGQLEKDSDPVVNPFIEYVIEAIESGKLEEAGT